MSLPLAKQNELRQIITSQLSQVSDKVISIRNKTELVRLIKCYLQVDVQSHIQKVISDNMTKAEIDELSEEDLLNKIEEKGVLEEVMNRLNIVADDSSHYIQPAKSTNNQSKPKKSS